MINSQHTPPVDQRWSTKVSQNEVNKFNHPEVGTYRLFCVHQLTVQWNAVIAFKSLVDPWNETFLCSCPSRLVLLQVAKHFPMTSLHPLSQPPEALDNTLQVDTVVG